MVLKELSVFGEISLFLLRGCKGIITFLLNFDFFLYMVVKELSAWWFCGTFAGKFPANVATFAFP